MLFYKDDICVFFGKLNPLTHSHHAIEISIGEESPMSLFLNNDKGRLVDACIILPDQPHKLVLDSGRGEKITIMIDADLPLSRKITCHYRKLNKKYEAVPRERIVSFLAKIKQAKKTAHADEGKQIYALVHQLLRTLFPDQEAAVPIPMNSQVDKVTRHVKLHIRNTKFRFKELADMLSLSESRLSHLFKQETGIPFRKYVLWTRLKTAVEAVQDGNSITQASYISGFADSSHFYKVYTEMFGLKPSLPLKEYTHPPADRKQSLKKHT
jgi:AraC-like DNA-binding protein